MHGEALNSYSSMPSESTRALQLSDEILSLLERSHDRASTELHSDSGGESVVWAIISSFLVSVAANLFTKGLPHPRSGRLSDHDLEEIERVFSVVANRNLEVKRQTVEQVVAEKLPRYLSAPERGRLTSEITDAIIRSCQIRSIS